MSKRECQAKDPSACPYHGTEIRINRIKDRIYYAAASGNTKNFLNLKEELRELEHEFSNMKDETEESLDSRLGQVYEDLDKPKFTYKKTGFTDNKVAIHPSGCGCTDCIVGNSFPHDDGFFSDELAEDIMLRGRKLHNSTKQSYVVTITQDEYSDRYRMNINDAYVNPRHIVKKFTLEAN